MGPNKNIEKHHVDLETGILYGLLKQIRATEVEISENPTLVSIWYCDIDPKNTQRIVALIRDHLTDTDSVPLTHIKRFMKVDDYIRAILCSVEYIGEKELIDLIHEHCVGLEVNSVGIINVPRYAPQTKEITQEWSSKYWPIAWKGNPNHQFLNSVQFDIPKEKELISTLLNELEHKQNSDNASATLIAENSNDSITLKTIQVNNGSKSPYDHSVMRAISSVAKDELERRESNSPQGNGQGYLCHNMIVYTTHEPCVMCCMALVHSRIGRLVYLQRAPTTGGLESNYQLGDRDGLNWKFQIWKWLGQNEIHRLELLVGNDLKNINY
ncbi:tRNA-specific adenosine deaminase subunit [Spathaspora sp. JA1]|nr:tRNA-specific adenosine deaminase subunit [Spathaspora sp. JA1]